MEKDVCAPPWMSKDVQGYADRTVAQHWAQHVVTWTMIYVHAANPDGKRAASRIKLSLILILYLVNEA